MLSYQLILRSRTFRTWRSDMLPLHAFVFGVVVLLMYTGLVSGLCVCVCGA